MKIHDFILKAKTFILTMVSIFFMVYIFFSLRGHFLDKRTFLFDAPEVLFTSDLPLPVSVAVGDIRNKISEHVARGDLYSVDIALMLENIKTILWVKNVSVGKVYPSKLIIVIEPRIIIANIYKDGKYYPVDDMGNILNVESRDFSKIIISGNGANERLNDILKIIENYPYIYKHIKYLEYINGVRWNIKLYDVNSGLLIKLDMENTMEELDKLMDINLKTDILKRNISEIDMRDMKKILIKQKE